MTTLPKSSLVDIVLRTVLDADIRAAFRIEENTVLSDRLASFPRRQLIDFIREAGPAAQEALKAEQDQFPLRAAPTLYLLNILGRPSLLTLADRLERAEAAGRDHGLFFDAQKPIRVVYVRSGLRRVLDRPPVFECVFSYERKLDYIEGAPESNEYGEMSSVWTLENALLWLPQQDVDGGVLSCTTISAVSPILSLMRSMLGIECSIPDLTDKMLWRITEGSRPRSATFGRARAGTDILDVRTVTLYDDHLNDSSAFQSLSRDGTRQQTSGFYTGHEDLLVGGLGVTRRYARIWTPRHLHRDELTRLAMGMLFRTQEELAEIRIRDPQAFVTFYTKHRVRIAKKELAGTGRRSFDRLVWLLLRAREEGRVDCQAYMQELLTHAQDLKLEFSLVYQCPNCGDRHITCRDCDALLTLSASDLTKAACTSCAHNQALDETFACECGEVIPILSPLSHLFVCPSEELVQALEHYLGLLRHNCSGTFAISQGELQLLPSQRANQTRVISLDDLQFWRVRAHLHVHDVRRPQNLIPVIGRTKEKCYRDNRPPNQARCEECLLTLPTRRQLRDGDLCLPRVFGIPIEVGFDGIHHGHEVADIRYEDSLNGRPVQVAIHVKSKSSSNPPRGLGRTNRRIRELYTQVYYSLYLMAIGRTRFDVLGIAIPNRVSADVIESLGSLINRFGVEFMVVDHQKWVSVFDLARGRLE